MLTSTDLGPIESLASHDGSVGSGTYLLTGANEQTGASGQTYLQLTLEDATGRVTGFA